MGEDGYAGEEDRITGVYGAAGEAVDGDGLVLENRLGIGEEEGCPPVGWVDWV